MAGSEEPDWKAILRRAGASAAVAPPSGASQRTCTLDYEAVRTRYRFVAELDTMQESMLGNSHQAILPRPVAHGTPDGTDAALLYEVSAPDDEKSRALFYTGAYSDLRMASLAARCDEVFQLAANGLHVLQWIAHT
jgi:hypothetical protein